jgi:exosome complex component RRP41
MFIRDGKIEGITLLQMDGQITKDELKEAIKLAKKGCLEIYRLQKEALFKRCRGEDFVE